MRHAAHPLVLLLGALWLAAHVLVDAAAAAGKEVPLRFGAGCEFSDFASLSTSSGDDEPSFRLLHDSGLGKGVYTLHFANFNLPNDDFVLLRAKNVDKSSPDAQVLAGGNTTGSFFSAPILGEGFIFELYRHQQQKKSSSASGLNDSKQAACFGVEVSGMIFTAEKQAEAAQDSQLALGLPQVGSAAKVSTGKTEQASSKASSPNNNEDKESICGTDESQEAVCLEKSTSTEEQTMYRTSKAVARLMIRKDNNMNVAYCTGFLLGCEGHLITNQHCIGNWLDALNTYIEFSAEASTCGASECNYRGACPGRFEAGNATLTAVSTDLDYALIKITTDDPKYSVAALLAQVGGYLQLRASGPKLQEEIYIPQHPMGQGKRIAWTASGKPGRIESLTAGECGGQDAGYYVDTNEGSSGSPVIAVSDNTVVALHHCGGCLNGGIPSQKLIADLETKGVLPRCAIAP